MIIIIIFFNFFGIKFLTFYIYISQNYFSSIIISFAYIFIKSISFAILKIIYHFIFYLMKIEIFYLYDYMQKKLSLKKNNFG